MPDIYMVLDTSAVRSYMRGEPAVGERIAELRLGVEHVSVPVLCLAEAHREATGEEALVLDLLPDLRASIVTPVREIDGPLMGGWSRILGSHDLAHAALDAAEHRATLMTSERKTVNLVLAEGWPIIDL